MKIRVGGFTKEHGRLNHHFASAVRAALSSHTFVDPQNIGFSFDTDGNPRASKAKVRIGITGIGSLPGKDDKVAIILHDVSLAVTNAASAKGIRHEIVERSAS